MSVLLRPVAVCLFLRRLEAWLYIFGMLTMKTSKPFSTISYNTITFLKRYLDKAIDEGEISFYAFIRHLPEDDEAREHIHLFVVPNGKIDTVFFAHKFEQFVAREKLPRRWMMCRSSKFGDWYLYGLHDADFLEAKGQRRKHQYSPNQVYCSDSLELKEYIDQIDYTCYTSLGSAIRAARSGESMDSYLMRVPVKMVHFRSIESIWKHYFAADVKQISNDSLNRAGRVTHSPKRVFRSPHVISSFHGSVKMRLHS